MQHLANELDVSPVTVQGPRGVERAYDVTLQGKAIEGARHQRKRDALRELQAMRKVLGGCYE